MTGEKLKKAFEEADISPVNAAEILGISRTNLYLLFKKDTFEIDYLRKASVATGKPLSYFFEEEYNIFNNSSTGEKFKQVIEQKYVEVMEENRKLWRVLMSNGIKVDLGKFEGLPNLQSVFFGSNKTFFGTPQP